MRRRRQKEGATQEFGRSRVISSQVRDDKGGLEWSPSCRKGGQGRRSERGKNSGGGKEEMQEGFGIWVNFSFFLSQKSSRSHQCWPKLPGHVTDGVQGRASRCWGKQVRKLKAHSSCSSSLPTPSYSGHRRTPTRKSTQPLTLD